MIISFSGLDGSGKTTQIKMLLDYFKGNELLVSSIYDLTNDIRYHDCKVLINYYGFFKNKDVIHTRFRLNSDENNDLMNIIEYSNFDNFYLAEATTLQDYFDARQLDDYVNKKLLKTGKTLIYDRYYYDEIAFKTVFGSSYNRIKKIYADFRKPDLSFYIKVSPEISYERNLPRKDSQTTIYKDVNCIKKLSEYFDLIANEYNLIVIDGELKEQEIHQIVLNHIESHKG